MILLDDIDDSEFYDTQTTEQYDSGMVLIVLDDYGEEYWNDYDSTEQRLEIYLNDL
jgi:hypothetical protein